MLFWLKATCADHTKNVLIVKFQRVVRVVKFTDKLFSRVQKKWNYALHISEYQMHSLWWNDSPTNHRLIPNFVETHMINTKRCNRNDWHHQDNCMYYTNRYDRLQATLKLNFFPIQNGLLKQFIHNQSSNLQEPCRWRKCSKQSH